MRITAISTLFALSLVVTACGERKDEDVKTDDRSGQGGDITAGTDRSSTNIGGNQAGTKPGSEPGMYGHEEVGSDQKGPSTTAQDPSMQAEAVQMSDEMRTFIGRLDGTDVAVVAALKEYGANDEITKNQMGVATLRNPRVIAREGECYTVQGQTSGSATRTYRICWEQGKINKIEEQREGS